MQFTVINHSKKAQNTGLSGYREVHRNQSFKKSAKHGVIRDKNQFTSIVHSNRAKTLDYRDKKQFTIIVHSKKAQNTGLSGYKAIHRNHSFKKSPKHGVIGV
jgi:hypothetical protein